MNIPLQVVWHLSVKQATSGTPISQVWRGLLDYDVLDKNQSLICHSNVNRIFYMK